MQKIILVMSAIFLLSMISPKPTRIVFFGDSITERGVTPGGYIDKMKQALEVKGLSDKYELVGAGIGGNKIYDLYFRLDDDVLSKKPDVVVVYVGVNDVWHKTMFGTGTDPAKFEQFYTAMIKKMQAQNIHVILCTPAVIGEKTDYSNQQDGDMNRYARIVRDIAKATNCPVCDLRKAFLDYNLVHNTKNDESGILTLDKVHLNDQGNQLVADMLLDMVIAK